MGNLDSLRDWGHARDYVEMQWLLLQQPTPGDLVIATAARNRCAASLGWRPTKTEAAKEATLRREGFVVVGSMENPPTNPRAAAWAHGR